MEHVSSLSTEHTTSDLRPSLNCTHVYVAGTSAKRNCSPTFLFHTPTRLQSHNVVGPVSAVEIRTKAIHPQTHRLPSWRTDVLSFTETPFVSRVWCRPAVHVCLIQMLLVSVQYNTNSKDASYHTTQDVLVDTEGYR